MKQSFTSFSWACVLVLAEVASGQTPPNGPPAGRENSPIIAENVAGAAEASALPNGQKLMAEAAAQLMKQPAISAKIRQRIDLFGHPLVGVGSYQQLNPATEKLIRLELKIQLAEQSTSMQQVCDGRFLWIRREMPQGTSLARVDLRRLQDALAANGAAAQADPLTYWLILGGLPKLISGLEGNFQFEAPQASQLAKVPVWMLEGHWKPARLAALWPAKKEELLAGKLGNLDDLPEQLPHQVHVSLGRDDLFPYRIEYRRAEPQDKTLGGAPTVARAMVTMELFEVELGGVIDRARFAYQPAENEVADHTELYLKSLGLKTAEKKKPASDKR